MKDGYRRLGDPFEESKSFVQDVVLRQESGGDPLQAAGPVVGASANAWDDAAVGAGDDSASVDCFYQYRISAFGTADGATTISAWISQDDTTYFDTGESVVLSGAGDFHISFQTAARYVRLRSSDAVTITATIAGK